MVVDVLQFDGDSFNWRSSVELASVFVRTADGGAQYDYQPQLSSDVGLSAGDAIVGISFCSGNVMPTPEATGTPRPTPPDTATVLDGSTGGNASSASLMGIVLVGLALAGTLLAASLMGFGAGRTRRRPANSLAGAWSTSTAAEPTAAHTRRFQVRP